MRTHAVWLAFAAIVLLGALLRLGILSSPLGQVEADESIVGLMALHILAGETPAFYWGQPYLGSLEAYLVAAAFALFGPSNLVLKLVPGFVYGLFVLLLFLGARRDYGDRVALLSAIYLALPPSFLAFWSLKARGGYVELLALGQALLFITPAIALPGRRLSGRLALAGFVSGLLLWIHPLGLVYVIPVGLHLFAHLGRRLLGFPLLAGLVGGIIGLAPALAYNLDQDGETLRALSGRSTSLQTFQDNLATLARIGLPVMVGLGQATSSPILFAQSWPDQPGSRPWVSPLLLALVLVSLLPTVFLLAVPGRPPRGPDNPTARFGLAILTLTPTLAALGRFGELVAEPRYALPLYSTVPLFAAALVALGRRWLIPATLTGCAILALNAYSLASADPRLNLPTTASGSTEPNRAALIAHLEQRGLTEFYADYWLAYPVTFESRERVLAAVSSGGYDRFPPYPHLVSLSDRPAFVFIRGSPEQAAFEQRLQRAGGRASREAVSIYDLYLDVEPLERLRPP